MILQYKLLSIVLMLQCFELRLKILYFPDHFHLVILNYLVLKQHFSVQQVIHGAHLPYLLYQIYVFLIKFFDHLIPLFTRLLGVVGADGVIEGAL